MFGTTVSNSTFNASAYKLVPIFVDICNKGYGMLTDAWTAGEDWGDLQLRRKIAKQRFADWNEKMQSQGGGLSAFLGPDSERHVLVVEILAKIVECFHKMEKFKPAYESSTSRNDGPDDRRRSRFLSITSSSKSNTSSQPSFPGPISGVSGVSPFLAALAIATAPATVIDISTTSKTADTYLSFPSAHMLVQFDQRDEAEVLAAVGQFEECARNFQKAMTTHKKVQWALYSKQRMANIFDDLEKYNDGLFKITKKIRKEMGQSSTITNPIHTSFQEFHVHVQLPFRQNRKFCGRKDILNRLSQILEPRDLAQIHGKTPAMRTDVRMKSAVLHGLGDIGKSQIALEKWRSSPDFQEISNILDIPIDSSGRLSKDATDLAMTVVHTWLSAGENQGWLLLLDNNDRDNECELEKLILICHWGSVIITTRLPNLQRFGECVVVQEIGAEEGVELLLKSSGSNREKLAEPGI
ncbi:hypothetical protein RUND412_007200 [Rhizina undulata]